MRDIGDAKADKLVVPAVSLGKIRINASIGNETSWSPWVVSNNLTITNNGNSAPSVNWNMADPTYLSVGENYNFNVLATDEDDELAVSWDFGDGVSGSGNNVIHNYSLSGVYPVALCVQETTHNTSRICFSKKVIVLKEGINVMIVVTSPASGRVYSNLTVPFNISRSYIADCTAGNVVNPVISTKILNCTYMLAPGSLAVSTGSLFINWTMGNGINFYGNWSSGNYQSLIDFSYKYGVSGVYTSQIKMKYIPNSGTSTEGLAVVTFTTGEWYCSRTANEALWLNANTNNKVNATDDCALYSSLAGEMCCPTNLGFCSNDGKCSGQAIYCEDLLEENQCEDASQTLGVNSVERTLGSDDVCGYSHSLNSCNYYHICGCIWNETLNDGDGACMGGYEITSVCNPVSYGECYWQTSVENKCDKPENTITIVSKATFTNTSSVPAEEILDCQDNSRTYACPSTAKLPFFDVFGLIGALMIIMLSYVGYFAYEYFIKKGEK
jgi:hypothetical protein